MSSRNDLVMYGRFISRLRGYLRTRITLDEARDIVRRRMDRREENFFRLVERGIFGHPRSPYLPLLSLADCGPGDLRAMVRARGIEGALCKLREAGVFFSFEEFKGRRPVVRQGCEIQVRPRDFDNPFASATYYGLSGGTTGVGTRVGIDLEHLAAQAPNVMLAQEAHGALGLPSAVWYGVPPDISAMNSILMRARFGQMPRRWFTPFTGAAVRAPFRYRLMTRAFTTLGRLSGNPIPSPEKADTAKATELIDWMTKTLKEHGGCQVVGHVSQALRVSIAAQARGIDLTGVHFWCSGEPPTPAKVRGITASGARFVPNYYFTEVGAVGYGCANPVDDNDIHLFRDSLAAIRHPRLVDETGIEVESFHFTTLLPTAPKILFNVESDDYGVIEERQCGCALESHGHTQHLREIRSFRKLTGEGVTLVGTEMLPILEEVLPARFGGSSLDYQLSEEEDERGFTRLVLKVSPRVSLPDETLVVEAVLEAMRRRGHAAAMAQAVWKGAESLRVSRAEPSWTARGKFSPLQPLPASPDGKPRPGPPEAIKDQEEKRR